MLAMSSRWYASVKLLWSLATLGPLSVGAAPAIVENGQPRADIVIADAPARMTRLAARDLQTYLKRITGASLAITNRPGPDVPLHIYVGKSGFTDALKLSTVGLAHGAFRMASGTNWLALLGPDKDFVPMEPWAHNRADMGRAQTEWDAQMGGTYGNPYTRLYDAYNADLGVWLMDDGGTMNAVCEYLRSLGVRWYFPGELGEIVPARSTLPLPVVDRTVTPDFPMRRFSYWYDKTENLLWNLRMGVNYGHELMGLTQNCHGSKYVYMRDEVKKAHPDWYAIWDGQWATNHSYSGAPCLSSKGLFAEHVKFARKMFDIRNEPMLSLDMCDGYGSGMCECSLCKGKGTPDRGRGGVLSDYVWDYVNRVAKELHRTHPERKVSGLAYTSYTQPPAKIDALSPNLALVLCQWRSGLVDHQAWTNALALRQEWLQKLPSREVYIYDYYLHSRPRYGFDHLPVYFPRLIARDLRSLKGISKGDMIEVYLHSDPKQFTWDALAVMHLNIYVTAALWWRADADLDALLDEYYTLFYGPAAREMKAFIEYGEAHWPGMTQSAATIERTLALLAAAQAAAGDGVYGRRVGLAAEYVRPMEQLRDRLLKARQNVPDARVLPRTMKGKPLDGNLEDDAFWPKTIRNYPMHDAVSGQSTGGRGRQPSSSFQVFHGGDEALYFGVRCTEPDMTNLLVMASGNDDTNLWSGDFVEVLLETQTHSYYRIAVNPAGAMLDVDMSVGGGGNKAWSSGAMAAVRQSGTGWTVELRVPWAGEMARNLNPLKGINGRMPTPIYPWSVNVCRQRVRDGKVQRAAWSPTGTNRFDDVMKFGTMYVK
jgi:hypothetical protein